MLISQVLGLCNFALQLDERTASLMRVSWNVWWYGGTLTKVIEVSHTHTVRTKKDMTRNASPPDTTKKSLREDFLVALVWVESNFRILSWLLGNPLIWAPYLKIKARTVEWRAQMRLILIVWFFAHILTQLKVGMGLVGKVVDLVMNFFFRAP